MNNITPPSPAAVGPSGGEERIPDAHGPLPRSAPAVEGRLLGDLASWLWRLQDHLRAATGDDAPTALRAAQRDVDTMWAILADQGVTVRDYNGAPVPRTGSASFRIVGYETREDATGSTVVQTLTPEVRLGGQIVQHAEVIASRPADWNSATPAGDEANVGDEERST